MGNNENGKSEQLMRDRGSIVLMLRQFGLQDSLLRIVINFQNFTTNNLLYVELLTGSTPN